MSKTSPGEIQYNTMAPSSASRISWILFLTAAGLVLRLYGLDSQNVWMDEVASLGNAHVFSSGGLVGLAKADHIAPLHSIILWLSVTLGGENAYAMRLPSVIVGVINIPVLYLLGARITGSVRVGLICAALIAFSPYAIWYSQEARMYAMFLLLSSLYVLTAWPVVRRNLTAAELIGLFALTTVSLYAHHYALLLSASFGLFLLIAIGLGNARIWAFAGSQLAAALVFTYWIYLTADKLDANAGFAKPLTLLWTPYTLFNFGMGFSLGPSVTELRVSGPVHAIVNHWASISLVMISMAIVGLIGVRRLLRQDLRIAGLWLLIWGLVPIALAILVTFVANIAYNARYVILSYPALLILLAVGMNEIFQNLTSRQSRESRGRAMPTIPALAVVILVACTALALTNWYSNDEYSKEDVRSLAVVINSEAEKKPLLIADNTRILPILRFYHAELPGYVPAVDNILWARTPEKIAKVVQELPTQSNEIWLFEYRSWETDPTSKVRSELEKRARLVGQTTWSGVSLRRYQMNDNDASKAS